MTKEDIIRIALEVGFSDYEIDKCQLMFERFAHLVIQQEREACAKLCGELSQEMPPVGEFAAYQQYLINATPQELQLQDISTVPGGKYIDLGVKLGSMIPEYGIIFDVLGDIANSVIGMVYKPKETIAQRLKSHGIDIYADDTYIVNDEYPDTDPRHFEIILPNGIWTNAQYQSAYAALLYYQKVLGFDVSKWINRISPAERQFLFRPGDAQWPAQYQGLAMLHGHANPYISKAKFEK